MLAIVDYGVGNLFSLVSSLKSVGAECCVSGDADELRRADKIILPGVGAFGDARQKLTERGLDRVVREEAAKKPLLGICLGMQMLLSKSFEYGEHEGLGLIGGNVRPLKGALGDPALKIPHMGWNALRFLKTDDPLLSDVSEGEYVYYVHSYYAADCADDTSAVSDYGALAVTGVVHRGNVWGTQFHPEKSGDTGLRILRAFAGL